MAESYGNDSIAGKTRKALSPSWAGLLCVIGKKGRKNGANGTCYCATIMVEEVEEANMMRKRNALAAVTVGLAMVATTTMPTFAATANSNHSGSSVQGKLNKNLKNAQKWAESQTQQLLGGKDPTAGQVTAGLLKTYAKIQVWPKGLLIPPNEGSQTTTATDWVSGATVSRPGAWVGLRTVFPGQPVSQWPKFLGMTNAPATKPITAATLAKWILDWEEAAHKVNTDWEPTKNAFNLLRLYNFFYGTNLTKPTTVVNAHDLAAVENNVVEVSQGYRMLARNKVQLLMPMINRAGDDAPSLYGGYFTRKNYGWKALAPTIRGFDTVTFTFQRDGNVMFNYDTHDGVILVLNAAFVRNGITTGQAGPVWGDIKHWEEWLKSHPVPLTLPWNQGQYTGQPYPGVKNLGVGKDFFTPSFSATDAYLLPRYGGGGGTATVPSYVFVTNQGQVSKVQIVAGQSYPELDWYGMR